jgi:hypothetical protein
LPGKFQRQMIKLHVGLIVTSGQDQRRLRLVDQYAVGFIDDDEVQAPQQQR